MVFLFAYRSCPAVLADPFVGILATNDTFLTSTLRILAVWPFLALTLEILMMTFSSRASSTGTASAKGAHSRHQVVNHSLLNVILLSF